MQIGLLLQKGHVSKNNFLDLRKSIGKLKNKTHVKNKDYSNTIKKENLNASTKHSTYENKDIDAKEIQITNRGISPNSLTFSSKLGERRKNNMNLLVDLDHSLSHAAKVGIESGGHAIPDSSSVFPSSSLGTIMTTLGGILSVGGLYIGFENFINGHQRLQKLEKLNTKYSKISRHLNSSMGHDSQEAINVDAYLKTISHAKKDSMSQKWVGGCSTILGSGSLFASIFLPVLAVPGLAIMSIYSLHNVFKNRAKLQKSKNIRFEELNGVETKLGREGKGIFEKILKGKRTFYKKMMTAWGLFGAGNAVVLTGALLVSVGTAMPIMPLIIAAPLIVMGISLVVDAMMSNKNHHTLKNENRINRQFLGNVENILWGIAGASDEFDVIRKFKNEADEILKQKLPKEYNKMGAKHIWNKFTYLSTLGISNKIASLDEMLKDTYFEHLDNDAVKQEMRDARMSFMKDTLEKQIINYDFLCNNFDKMEHSFIKQISIFQNINKTYDANRMKEIINDIRGNISEKILLRKEIDNKLDQNNESNDFRIMYNFAINNNISWSLFKEVMNELNQKKLLDVYLKESYFNSYEGDIQFLEDDFCNKLSGNDKKAKDLLNIFNKSFNKIVINNLYNEYEYRIEELCDHLEARLEKSHGEQ